MGVAGLGVMAGLAWWSIRHPRNHYSEDQIEALLTADEVELFSVNPSRMDYGDDPRAADAPEPKPMKTAFGEIQGYPVLGSCKIATAEELEVVRNAIRALVAAGRQWDGAVAMCFWPRHGVRIKSGGMNCDLLICYECSRAEIFRGEAPEGCVFFSSVKGSAEPGPEGLNGLLKARGIKLPKQAGH
jgi:hypothetical protein